MAKVRVYELAKELGVDSRTIMRTLSQMGEFVRSASSTIEPAAVGKVRRAFSGGAPTPTGETRIPMSGGSPIPMPSAPDGPPDVLSEAARIFGVSPTDPRLSSLARKSRPRPKPVVSPRRRQSAGDFYDLDWANRMITPDVRRAYIAAGLDRRSAAVVEQCIRNNLRPKDLSIRVDGVRAGARIRGGESVASVAARLRALSGDHSV